MKHKLSQWHSADTKPVHVGMYQVMDGGEEYSFWDSKRWSLSHHNQRTAEYFHRHKHVSWIQNKQWRGIVK